MAGERGQATVEYVGLVALVAVVVSALAAIGVGGGEAVRDGVVRAVHRGLCIVRGGECDLAERPCVVAVSSVTDGGSVDLLLVRVGSDELVLREDRSDGTSQVTFARQRSGGLEVGSGGGAELRLGRRRLQLGTEVTATLLGLLGSARTWELPDHAAAARLTDRIVVDGARDLGRRVLDGGDPVGDDGPRPARTTTEVGIGIELAADASRGPASLGLRLGASDLAGASLEPATGRRTYLVRRRNELAVSLGTRLRDAAHGTAAADELYTVTVDHAGRAVDLGILRGGELGGSVDLPRALQPVAGMLGVGGAGGRRWEAEEHLDLTEPVSLAAARDFLAQVVRPRPRLGRLVRVSGALREVLDERGVLDARTYAISDTSSGVGGKVPVPGGRVGVGYERARRRAHLVAAVQRDAGGIWRRRGDCVRR